MFSTVFFFFPTSAVMILLGGQAMATIDAMSQGATVTYLGGDCGGYIVDTTASKLPKRVWTVIMGCLVLVLSMAKDMSSMWQISAVGTLSVFVIVLYSIVGSSVVLSQESTVLIMMYRSASPLVTNMLQNYSQPLVQLYLVMVFTWYCQTFKPRCMKRIQQMCTKT